MVTGHWQKRKAITLNICEVLFAGLYLLYVWTRKGARNPGVNVLHFGFEKPACCKAWLSSEQIITTKCTTRRNVCFFAEHVPSQMPTKSACFSICNSYINMTGYFVSYYTQLILSRWLCAHTFENESLVSYIKIWLLVNVDLLHALAALMRVAFLQSGWKYRCPSRIKWNMWRSDRAVKRRAF